MPHHPNHFIWQAHLWMRCCQFFLLLHHFTYIQCAHSVCTRFFWLVSSSTTLSTILRVFYDLYDNNKHLPSYLILRGTPQLELVYSYRLHKREVQLLASTHPSPSSQGPWHSRPWRLSEDHIMDSMGAICTMPGFCIVTRVVPLHISLSMTAISSSHNANWLNWETHALAKPYSHSSTPSSTQAVTSPWRIVSVIDFGCNSSDETKSDLAQ